MILVWEANPALVSVAQRVIWGETGGVTTLYLSCGHSQSMMTREAPQTLIVECWQCVCHAYDDKEWNRLQKEAGIDQRSQSIVSEASGDESG